MNLSLISCSDIISAQLVKTLFIKHHESCTCSVFTSLHVIIDAYYFSFFPIYFPFLIMFLNILIFQILEKPIFFKLVALHFSLRIKQLWIQMYLRNQVSVWSIFIHFTFYLYFQIFIRLFQMKIQKQIYSNYL